MHALKPSFSLLRLLGVALTALLLQTPASAQDEAFDPPGRVARVSYASGNLSFAPGASEQWAELPLNRPLAAGDNLWVPGGGRAELHIGSSALRLSEKTSLSFLTLSDQTVQLKMTQGSMVVRLRSLSGKENFEIDTPNLAFSLQEPGEYRVNVNQDNSTTVIVRRGTGIAYGDRDSISIREAEQANFTGTNLAHASIDRMLPYDSFDLWVNQRDRAEDSSVSARYVSRDMIGYQQLDEYGSWETHAEYGAIWWPRVTEVGWAPYRHGHWSWIAPWGWTWIDRAPWGFAPYHYGRWAHIGARWAWVPGRHAHREVAVYAPALVAFVGSGGLTASLSFNFGRGISSAVAWFPLGPGEAYRPAYRSSTRYMNNINRGVVINNTVINNTVINNQTVYVNQHYTHAVPASTFVKGEFVGPHMKPLKPRQIDTVQIGNGAPAIAPEDSSILGVARRVASPDNERWRQRPVVATVPPAELPGVQLNPLQGPNSGLNTRPESGPNRNGRDQTRVPDDIKARTLAVPAATSNILLHNAGRFERGDRGDRVDRSSRAQPVRVAEPFTGPEQRSNSPIDTRPAPTANPGFPAMRSSPTTPEVTEQRRPSGRVRGDERDAEPRETREVREPYRPQFNSPNPVRTESRRETPNAGGMHPQPSENGFNIPQPRVMERMERPVERPVAAPREISRPGMPQEAMMPQAPRQPNVEIRREAPTNAVRPEKEQRQNDRTKEHKERSEAQDLR